MAASPCQFDNERRQARQFECSSPTCKSSPPKASQQWITAVGICFTVWKLKFCLVEAFLPGRRAQSKGQHLGIWLNAQLCPACMHQRLTESQLVRDTSLLTACPFISIKKQSQYNSLPFPWFSYWICFYGMVLLQSSWQENHLLFLILQRKICALGTLRGSQWQDSSNSLLALHLPLCLCWEKEEKPEAKWERIFT